MDDAITCTEEQYQAMSIAGTLEPKSIYYATDIDAGFITRTQTVQEVIQELYERSAVTFRCTHCGTECFEHQKFTPKCPNCGSLMDRCGG